MKKYQIIIESLGDSNGEYIITKDLTRKLKIGDKLGLFKTEEYEIVCLSPLIANKILAGKKDKFSHLKVEPFKIYKRDGKYAV